MSAPKFRDTDLSADIDAARADARSAYQSWQDAEAALEAAKRAVGEAQQRYYATADRLHRLEGPSARRAAQKAELRALENELKELTHDQDR